MWTPLTLAAPPAGSFTNANASLRLISVDPWTHGKRIDLGDPNTYLSFPNAINAVLDILGNTSYPAALGLAIAANNLTDMGNNLSALGNAFPLPDLQRMARRAQALVKLDTSKFNLVPYGNADRAINLSSLPSVRAMRRADLIQQAADNASSFLASSPIANLTSLLSDKTAFTTALAGAQSAASANLTGSPTHCFRFYSDANISSNLLLGHPDHDFVLTSVFLFLGSGADLAGLVTVLS